MEDKHLVRVKELATKLGLRIHTHLHETKAEAEDSEAGRQVCLERLHACLPLTSQHVCSSPLQSPSRHRSDQKTRPIANFARLGLLDSQLIAVHMTQMTPAEVCTHSLSQNLGFSSQGLIGLGRDQVALIAEKQVNVVHCPVSNMKLASGVCPVPSLLAAGGNVALGTDGTASNNTLDMFNEARVASLLAKSSTHDAAVSGVVWCGVAGVGSASADSGVWLCGRLCRRPRW